MGFYSKIAYLVAIVAVCLGVSVMLFPVPRDLRDPWHARGVGWLTLGSKITAELGEKLGISSQVKIFKSMTDTAVSLLSFDDPKVKESFADFGGVSVRIFDPEGRQKNSPAFVYFHGGGWTIFSAKSYRHVTQSIAKETKYLVVSVEYRKAPEFVYPVQLKDCLTATKFLMAHAKEYGVDSSRVGIGGDSAGGTLAAAVSLAMREEDKPPLLKAQILIYPALQFMDLKLPSYQNETKVAISTVDVAWFAQMYAFGTHDKARVKAMVDGTYVSTKVRKQYEARLKHEILPEKNFPQKYKKVQYAEVAKSEYPELEKVVQDPFFAPLMADDLSNLPPTLILTCYYDVLRDDGYLYAHHLRNANVKVRLVEYQGGWHGALTYRTSFPIVKDIAQFVEETV